MNIEHLISTAEQHDIELFLDNGKLGYRAHQAQPNRELLKQLSQHKDAIFQYLQQQASYKPDYSKPLPVSTSQQRIWTIDQLEHGSQEFNIPVAILITRAVNLNALAERLKCLIERHYVLRCIFEEGEGELYQKVVSAEKLKLVLEDLTHLDEQQAIIEAQARIMQDNQENFNLAEDLPIRAIMFRLQQQHAVIYLNIHHIAVDESSVFQLLEELLAEHDILQSPAAMQYAEYVYWQQAYLRSYAFKQHQAAYVQSLNGAPALHSLPLDFPYHPSTSNTSAQYKFELEPDLTVAAFALCQQQQLTPFMLFQGALSAFLSIWTRSDDIVLGTPSILRPHEKFNQVVGCFLNLSVLRSQFSSDMTGVDVLKQARQLSLNLLDWQSVPFETLLDKLKPERSPLYSPLFQIFFSMHMQEQQNSASNNNGITALTVSRNTTKYDLTVHARVSKQHIGFNFDYKTDLFLPESIEQLALAFRHFLQTLIMAPTTALGQISLVTERDSTRLRQFNATTVDYPKSLRIDQLISQQAIATPQHVAIESEQSLTYEELEQHSNRIAASLNQLGVKSGDQVGIILERSALMVCTMLALMKLEAAYVPLDPAYPLQRLKYIYQQSNCTVLVSDSIETAAELGAPHNCNPESLLQYTGTPNLPAPHLGSAAIAYIIFTSGSTGQPKGIAIPHRNVVNFLLSMQKKPGISSQDKLLAVTPISFDISILELFLPLLSGACVVLAGQEKRDGMSLCQRLEQGDITLMQATPAGWQSVLDAGWKGQLGFKALVGGEILPAQLANQLTHKVSSLWNMYGPTETTVWSSIAPVNNAANNKITIGKPIANTEIYVITPDHQLCAIGQTGEIAIAGDGVSSGYYNQPELTQSRFITLKTTAADKRVYLTGDLGRMIVNGELQCLGRNDDQVKLRGFRIELTEIEAVMQRLPNIKQAAAVLHHHTTGTTLVGYYCTTLPAQQDDEQPLLLALRRQFPAYMVPERVINLPQLPLTPSGKIDRKTLAALTINNQRKNRVEATTDLQRQLIELWGNLTNQTDIGITDNFFSLGGDSISAVKIVRFLREQGYDMNNKLLFIHQTIEELTTHLPALLTSSTETEIVTEKHIDGIEMLLSTDGNNDDLAAILKEFSAH